MTDHLPSDPSIASTDGDEPDPPRRWPRPAIRLVGLVVMAVVGLVALLRHPEPSDPPAANAAYVTITGSPAPDGQLQPSTPDSPSAHHPDWIGVATEHAAGSILGLVRWHVTTIIVTAYRSTASVSAWGIAALGAPCTSQVSSNVHNGPVGTDPQVTINVHGTATATVHIDHPAGAAVQTTTVELNVCTPKAPGTPSPTMPRSPARPSMPEPGGPLPG